MVEGYILDETIGFVIEYLQDSAMFDAKFRMEMKRRGFMVKLWKGLPQS
jgi:hypothetical protein